MSWAELPGYFDWQDTYREWVLETPTDGVIVEIGVFCGRSLAFLAREAIDKRRDDLSIFGVDPFEAEDWMIRDCSHILAGRTLHETFDDLMTEHAQDEYARVSIVKGKSVPTARVWQRRVDRLYIDGDHSTEAVAADIAAWMPLIKPGGVIAGHDFGNFGVEPAVRAAFGADFEVRGSTWIHRVAA